MGDVTDHQEKREDEERPNRLIALLGPLAGLAFLVFKFGKFALVAVKGSKFLTTSLTMVISIGAYATFWGIPFAVGFVLLILIHELGHWVQLRREGLDAGAPVFIPFVGAAIALRQMPTNALVEARVGLAGPILGSVGALVCWAGALTFDSQMLKALAFTGFFLNLFNLMPISPLDGGRAMAAVHPAAWGVGVLMMLGLVFLTFPPNPILMLIVLVGVLETWSRWRKRHTERTYYALTAGQRGRVLATYLGLVAALVLGMDLTYVQRSF